MDRFRGPAIRFRTHTGAGWGGKPPGLRTINSEQEKSEAGRVEGDAGFGVFDYRKLSSTFHQPFSNMFNPFSSKFKVSFLIESSFFKVFQAFSGFFKVSQGFSNLQGPRSEK